MLQELRGREVFATTHVDVFGNVLHHVDDFHLAIELKSILREIAEAYGVADDDAP